MKTLLLTLLLTLFVAPLGLNDLASYSPPSLFAPEIESEVKRESPEETTPGEKVVAEKKAAPSRPRETKTETKVASSVSLPPEPEPASSGEEDLVSAIESEVIRLSNIERREAGVGELSSNSKLRAIAWAHSADMVARDFFSHDNPEGCSSSCRATNAGYSWRAIGENLYMMSGFKISPTKSASMVVEGWMNSPGHRTNLLKGTFTETGVGVVVVDGSVYVTALYAKPR